MASLAFGRVKKLNSDSITANPAIAQNMCARIYIGVSIHLSDYPKYFWVLSDPTRKPNRSEHSGHLV